LRLAIGIAMALAKVHQRGLIHKDLKPGHILVDRASGEVRLTGFGIASRLPREHLAPEPPEVIAGTLAYMAPEQTGRMNRSVDARSDLYALGVTLYQMLTGGLPFTAPDLMELVHCHIARRPVPPAERAPGLPVAISAIVMKLLAKTTEDRYQTAAGVAADLRHCLTAWETSGSSVEPFPLGAHDIPDVLRIPEKLYGREQEVRALLAAFERVVARGRPELVLVSGFSGIGKSSLVYELHKAPHGLFVSAKFDQYQRDIPYATPAQALQNLVRQLLVKSEAELAVWRESMLNALGANGRLVVDLVPELEILIGPQPPVPDLPLREAEDRFLAILGRFLAVFARSDHPLVLFLDDLQWFDPATLKFLARVVSPPMSGALLAIGAYRDNEVGP
jgi:AAA ATPase domain/Protein kinase domain